ncbi:hypothetical protein ACHWQZ_G009835 [Mnemiopsis leidyi]
MMSDGQFGLKNGFSAIPSTLPQGVKQTAVPFSFSSLNQIQSISNSLQTTQTAPSFLSTSDSQHNGQLTFVSHSINSPSGNLANQIINPLQAYRDHSVNSSPSPPLSMQNQEEFALSKFNHLNLPAKMNISTEKGKELAVRANQLETMVMTIKGQYEREIDHYKTQLCQQLDSFTRLKAKAKQLKADYKDKQIILAEQKKLKEDYDRLVIQMEEERKMRLNERTVKSIESKKLIMAIRAELEQQKQANIDSKSLIIARTREKEELVEKLAKVEHELSKRDDIVMNLKKDVIGVTQSYKLVQQQLVRKKFESACLKLKIAHANCTAQVRERSRLPAPERYNLTQWKICQEDARKKLEENERRYSQYVTSLHEAADPEMVQFEEEPRGPPVEFGVPPLPLQRFDDILLGRVAPDLTPPPVSTSTTTVNSQLKTARINCELENIANMLDVARINPSPENIMVAPPGLEAAVSSTVPSVPTFNTEGPSTSGSAVEDYLSNQLNVSNVSLPGSLNSSLSLPECSVRNTPNIQNRLTPAIFSPDAFPKSRGRGRGRGRSKTAASKVGTSEPSPGRGISLDLPRQPEPTRSNTNKCSTSPDFPSRKSRIPSDESNKASRAPRGELSEDVDCTIPSWPSLSASSTEKTGADLDQVRTHSVHSGNCEYSSSRNSDPESNYLTTEVARKMKQKLQELFPVLSDGDITNYLNQLQEQRPYRLKTKRQPLFERLVSLVSKDLERSEVVGRGRKPSLSPDNTCVICLETLTVGEVHISNCAHRFHKACVDLWFATRNFTCPTCRTVQSNVNSNNNFDVDSYNNFNANSNNNFDVNSNDNSNVNSDPFDNVNFDGTTINTTLFSSGRPVTSEELAAEGIYIANWEDTPRMRDELRAAMWYDAGGFSPRDDYDINYLGLNDCDND